LAQSGGARAAMSGRNSNWRWQGTQRLGGYSAGRIQGAFPNAYGTGSPYFGYGSGFGGYGGLGYGGLGYGFGGGYYPGYANFDGYGPSGLYGRFYRGAPPGNGGFGYGPSGYGNNDTATYRYRGTSALPQVPPFENYAQPSPLVPYSYIYASPRTPQEPPHPEAIANPFATGSAPAK
jgi:hypothetical protein